MHAHAVLRNTDEYITANVALHCTLRCKQGVLVGGGDGTVTSFDGQFRDVAQAQLRGAVVAMSFRYKPTADHYYMMLNDKHCATAAVTLALNGRCMYALLVQCSLASLEHFNTAIAAS
jgi:hypothetical protein